MNVLAAAGRPILAPVQARGLLDTGTDVTCIASWVLGQLGIPVATRTSTHTAAGPVQVNLYHVSLSIADSSRPGSPTFANANLIAMELAFVLPDVDVLIGRD